MKKYPAGRLRGGQWLLLVTWLTCVTKWECGFGSRSQTLSSLLWRFVCLLLFIWEVIIISQIDSIRPEGSPRGKMETLWSLLLIFFFLLFSAAVSAHSGVLITCSKEAQTHPPSQLCSRAEGRGAGGGGLASTGELTSIRPSHPHTHNWFCWFSNVFYL